MRMNKVPKGWLKSIEAQKKKYPALASEPNNKMILPGRIHSIILFSKYIPLLTHEAKHVSSAVYASAYLEWSMDKLVCSSSILEEDGVVGSNSMDMDGNETISKERCRNIPEPKEHLFSSEQSISEFSDFLRETQKYYTSNIKSQVNAAKFQRILDAQYGYFLPLIKKYPTLEPYFKTVTKKRALGHFKLTRGKNKAAPMNMTTSIILLFMMHRNGVRRDVLGLVGLFLVVGLQPFALVLCIVIGKMMMDWRKNRVMKGFDKRRCGDVSVCNVENAKEVVRKPVGKSVEECGAAGVKKEYDAIVLGDTIDALYTAALLSKCGKRVCVLSSTCDAASGLIMQKDTDSATSSSYLYSETPSESKWMDKNNTNMAIPFDTSQGQIYNFSTIQSYLAPVLSTCTDIQGGVRFVPIGSETSGYPFAMMDIPTLNDTGTKYEFNSYILRPGVTAFLEDVMYYFCNAQSAASTSVTDTLLSFLKVCATIYASSSTFFLTKILPSSTPTSLTTTSKEDNAYGEAAIRPLSAFLHRCFPTTPTDPTTAPTLTPVQRHINSNLISYLTGIASRYEDTGGSYLSMAVFLSHINSLFKSNAFFYPVGGMRCLGHALHNVITSHGGDVYTNVHLQQFVCQPQTDNDKEEHVNINAVTCSSYNSTNKFTFYTNGPMVSTLGFIPTFVTLLPDHIRNKYGIPEGLSHLTQRRPLLKLIIALDGSAEDLDIPSLDYFRLPNVANTASSSSPQHDTATTLNDDSATTATTTAGKHKYKPNTSYLQIAFPSTKDPSWKEVYGNDHTISTCVVTVEADDDFVKFVDNQRTQHQACPLPKIYKDCASLKDNKDLCHFFVQKVIKDVIDIYPLLKDKILRMELHGPIHTAGLSQNPERYVAKGIRPHPSSTKFPNLYMSGTDVTLDTFTASIISSWMCVNSIMQYDYIDYAFLKKDITHDIAMFSCDDYVTGEEEELLPISVEEEEKEDGEKKLQ